MAVPSVRFISQHIVPVPRPGSGKVQKINNKSDCAVLARLLGEITAILPVLTLSVVHFVDFGCSLCLLLEGVYLKIELNIADYDGLLVFAGYYLQGCCGVQGGKFIQRQVAQFG